MKKIIKYAWIALTIIVFAWFTMSYIEILCKHNSPNPEYSEKNIIVNVVEWAADYYDYND